MGRAAFFAVALLGAAAGAAVATAIRISRRTGKPFAEAMYEVPAEARRWVDELSIGLREAVEAGKEAAAAKEEEIDRVLSGEVGLGVALPYE